MVKRILGALALGAMAIPAYAAEPAPLRIIAIDVEGGFATLYVTPEGHSLLIDTGWPAGRGGSPSADEKPDGPARLSSAQRIVAAMKRAGVERIDTLVVTHYHMDHVGGAVELMSLVPVGRVIDHGENREFPKAGQAPSPDSTAALYAGYLKAIGTLPRRVMRAGDTLEIDRLRLTAVNSDGEVLPGSLAKAGAGATVGCDQATTSGNVGGEENPRSLGLMLEWGETRILSLADTTWNVEAKLVCPRDRVGPVDLMFADNHGSANANNPVLVNTVQPRVVVFNNGPTKGAAPKSFATMRASPRIAGIWQIHTVQTEGGANAPTGHIVNLPGYDETRPLQMEVFADRRIRMINPRTGETVTYQWDGAGE